LRNEPESLNEKAHGNVEELGELPRMSLAGGFVQVSGSGDRFLNRGREGGRPQFPESAPEILPGIRKRVLRKFLYSLIYSGAIRTTAMIA